MVPGDTETECEYQLRRLRRHRGVDKHGRYWLHAIIPQTFTIAEPAEAEALIRTWAGYYVRWNDADREVYARLQRATVTYQLPDIRATAQHDWGRLSEEMAFTNSWQSTRPLGNLC
jgi:hypothetical protein